MKLNKQKLTEIVSFIHKRFPDWTIEEVIPDEKLKKNSIKVYLKDCIITKTWDTSISLIVIYYKKYINYNIEKKALKKDAGGYYFYVYKPLFKYYGRDIELIEQIDEKIEKLKEYLKQYNIKLEYNYLYVRLYYKKYVLCYKKDNLKQFSGEEVLKTFGDDLRSYIAQQKAKNAKINTKNKKKRKAATTALTMLLNYLKKQNVTCKINNNNVIIKNKTYTKDELQKKLEKYGVPGTANLIM